MMRVPMKIVLGLVASLVGLSVDGCFSGCADDDCGGSQGVDAGAQAMTGPAGAAQASPMGRATPHADRLSGGGPR